MGTRYLGDALEISHDIKLEDQGKIKLGDAGNDLEIHHDGTNSNITNKTGTLFINQDLNDGDIIFRSDDGTGGVAAYITIDGSVTTTKFNKQTLYPDSVEAIFGTGSDLKIKHDGTNSLIRNFTGNLTLRNAATDKDIIFESDDGSGGTTEYFSVDGSITQTKFSKSLLIKDNVFANFGDSNDFSIVHGGVNSTITNNTGNLTIKQNTNDGDIIFQSDDGSGGLATYITLDGSHTRTKFDKKILVADGEYVGVGDGADLQIMHNGTNTLIDNITGDVFIRQFADNKDIKFSCDDGSGGVTEYFRLDGSATRTVFSKEANFEDNVKLTFGAQPGGDLQIYHDGSNSYIDEPGTGALNIRSNSVVAGKYTGEVLFRGTADGAFEAFHDNSIKLSTTSTGIDVGGAIEMDKSLTMSHISDPSDPATGKSVIWSNTDGDLKIKINVGGTVVTRTLATFSD